ncbi:hypothetical protein MTR_5g040450 [Medicago truncatula]|uniref:Uncharacterized protein n=1 Tax=Medicago truncatula TaxID=3880 RepID=G7KDY6_MEDTR|nr:hypothetical protein MTR_5g040450 [Medicago truncatula]
MHDMIKDMGREIVRLEAHPQSRVNVPPPLELFYEVIFAIHTIYPSNTGAFSLFQKKYWGVNEIYDKKQEPEASETEAEN